MRFPATASRVHDFMRAIGERTGEGRIYLTGGATALLYGWRETTIDIDLKADPEPSGWFEALAVLKDELETNLELASPDQFVPVPVGWQDRSRFIGRFGNLEFYHFDFYGQALAKLERAHTRDLADVRSMVSIKLIDLDRLAQCYLEIEPALIRYPSVDARAFRERVNQFCNETGTP